MSQRPVLSTALLLLAVVVLVAGAAAVAFLVTAELTPADRVTAVAAATQAIAAVFIVVLTVVLAVTAYVALGTARSQADAAAASVAAARQANIEQRVEREVSVIPVLAAQLSVSTAEGNLQLQITAVNLSAHPALRVTMELHHGPWDSLPPDRPDARDRLLRDTPRMYAVVAPGPGKAFRWSIPPSELPEETVVRMRYMGPIGGTAWQTYRLVRPGEEQAASYRFLDLQRYIVPSVPGAEPIIMQA